jgi:hypothetical protein
MVEGVQRAPGWLGGVLRTWWVARYERRQARSEARDRHAAEELQRARDGYDRFPPSRT